MGECDSDVPDEHVVSASSLSVLAASLHFPRHDSRYGNKFQLLCYTVSQINSTLEVFRKFFSTTEYFSLQIYTPIVY